jgi:uncharacterized protein involved in exopolysaccharide biosynthesis
MSSNLESAQITLGPADLGSGLLLQAMLASLWRRKGLVARIVGAALALGVIAVLVMPPRYTTKAYIRGEFFAAPDTVAKDDQSTTAGAMNLELVRVIETQSRILLESHWLARRVAQQVGVERLYSLTRQNRFWPSLGGNEAENPEEKLDVAASRLLGALSVTSNPNTYLLEVSYRTGDPQLGELVTNAFMAELLRSAKLQTLSKQRAMAQDALAIQLAKFGDKHPSVVQARTRLAGTDELLKAQLNESWESVLQNAGENVTPATSSPSSSTTMVMSLMLLTGFVLSVGLALWLERNRWWWMYLDPSFRVTPSR